MNLSNILLSPKILILYQYCPYKIMDNNIDVVNLYDNSEPKKGYLIDPKLETLDDTVSYSCVMCGLRHNFGEMVHSYDFIKNKEILFVIRSDMNIDIDMEIIL